MFRSLLIANRGEIACRIARTARRLGLRVIAVYSDADADAAHLRAADEAWHLGPAPARDSYLRIERLLEVARQSGAEAVHPGYGFLSENPAFAEALADAGLIFVGPPAAAIRAMGLKDAGKRLMQAAGVPVVPGWQGAEGAAMPEPEALLAEAERIGWPVLIKAVAGGGGKGMRRVDAPEAFTEALAGARREAAASFGDDRVLIEKYLLKPRHIEVQVFADRHGQALHLYERDCSLQRRHQKVVEEAPAPGMSAEMRRQMGEAAVTAARAIGYEGAGTVEFIADVSDGLRPDRFYFMEMNTRLQVEHPVTEAITGQDLVEWQLRVAAGEPLPLTQAEIPLQGHAVEVRLYAENPARGFLPATGRLERLRWPALTSGQRIDSGVGEGDSITPWYDPMIAKLIAWGPDRSAALGSLAALIRGTELAGSVTNRDFLLACVTHPAFAAGDLDTGFIARHEADLIPAEGAAPEPLLQALAALVLAEPDAAGVDPFSRAPAGWRAWIEPQQGLPLLLDGQRLDLRLTRLRQPEGGLRVAGAGWSETLAVLDRNSAEGIWQVQVGKDRQIRLSVSADRRWIGWQGRLHRVEPVDPAPTDAAALGAERLIKAPLPGVVRQMLVAAGDRVDAGQPLTLVEAMKMEHLLRAGFAGTVRAVLVAAGALVQEGQVLVELEPEGAADA